MYIIEFTLEKDKQKWKYKIGQELIGHTTNITLFLIQEIKYQMNITLI